MSDRIDVHQHYLPDFYRDALAAAGIDHPDGMAAVPQWSLESALAMMARLGIAHACLSVSSPGVGFLDKVPARALARRLNEAGAALVRQAPDRFGFFAITPLPDVDGAVEEVRYALDTLGARGVVFETNFDGQYLGDAALEPVYHELNRRGAVLFLHPTSPHCPCGVRHGAREPADLTLGYPAPMLEFMFETTRSVTNMLLSGTFERFPNVRLIVPHAGACLPILAARIELLMNAGARPVPAAPADIRKALSRLYFDLAGAPVPEALGALLHIVDPSHLLYGSDWPFTPTEACEHLLSALRDTAQFDDNQRAAMFSQNARRLIFPADSAPTSA
jgi:6-methylsalicylate decarboxylase